MRNGYFLLRIMIAGNTDNFAHWFVIYITRKVAFENMNLAILLYCFVTIALHQ